MANGNKKITSPLEFKDGKLIVGQGIDAFQIAVDKEGGLLVEDPTTRIAGNYPDMYPWKAPEGYPEAAISFAKDGSYPPDNIPVSCLAGAIRALKQLVLATSTGVDTPPPDDPDTSLALGVEDGDLVVIASDGMWHKATPPTLEPTPEPTPSPTEGEDVQVMRLVRQYEPEAFALASMMLFTGVYIEKLGQVVTSNYVSHPDWHFPSGAVLYLDPANPGKMTEEDTGYPVGICQLPSDYGTTIYLEPLMWGIDKGINDSRRASYEVATGLTAALEAQKVELTDALATQKTELTDQMKAAHDLIDEHIQALNTSVASLQQFQTDQEALNETFATKMDIETLSGKQEALGTRINELVTAQEELKTETEHLAEEDTAIRQSISDHEAAVDSRFDELDTSLEERFAGVTTTTDALKTQIEESVQALNERLDNGDIDFWFPPEPLPFTPIDLKRCLIPGDMCEQILVDMAVRTQPSGTTGIYVEAVTYDEVTQFSTIILTGEFETGDNQIQYGLAKEFMPNMDCKGGEIILPDNIVTGPEDLPDASADMRGLVKLDGVTTTIDDNGNLKAVYTAADGTVIETPPVATEQVAGIMRPDGITTFVSSAGVLSAKGNLTLKDIPVASATTAGVVKVDGTSIQASEDGTLSAHAESVIIDPVTATTETLGLVKPDGSTITVTEDGTISAVGSSLPEVIPVNKLPMATSYSAGVVTTAERIESGGMGVVTSDLAYTESQRLEGLIQEAGTSGVPVATNKVLGGIVLGDRLISDPSVAGKVSAAPAFCRKVRELPIAQSASAGIVPDRVYFSLTNLTVGSFLIVLLPELKAFYISSGTEVSTNVYNTYDLRVTQIVQGQATIDRYIGTNYVRYKGWHLDTDSFWHILPLNRLLVHVKATSLNGELLIGNPGLQANIYVRGGSVLIYE